MLSQIKHVKFSVIMPAYNASKTISGALASVVDQTYGNVEIIVVDGDSKDETLSVVRSFTDRVNVLISEPDLGVYDAMNKGIKLASGDWLYFLGADDRLFDNRVLEEIAGALQTESDVLYGNVLVRGNCSWAKDNSIYAGKFSVGTLFTKNICHQAVFYSRHVFDKLGLFDIRYPVCADWDFNHRCFANCRVSFVNLVVAVFVAGGVSSQRHNDEFRMESPAKLAAYYNISPWHKNFNGHAEVFLFNALRELREKRFARSGYLLAIAVYHSNQRLYFLKKYLLNFYRSVKALSSVAS
jgi:glycosyltransferase involved in cell wall biosynthesis